MTTYVQTLMHLVKGIVGAGIFSMGVAFKYAGMLVALCLTPVMGIIVCHCATLVVRIVEFLEEHVQKELDKNKNNAVQPKSHSDCSYGDIIEKVLMKGGAFANRIAKFMNVYVSVGICVLNLGFCCTYVVFLGTNMDKVLLFFGVNVETHMLMLMCIIPMWLLSLITKLELLAPFSMFANILLVVVIGATTYYICQDLPPFSSTVYVAHVSTFPLFLSIALYSFECIGLIIPLRNAMTKPEQMAGMLGVLNVGFILVTPFIVLMGCMAYLKYGDEISGTVFINLPQTTAVEVLIILVCLQVILTYPVQLYIPVAIMWPLITKRFGPFKRPLLALMCFRTFLVALTLGIGEAIPYIHLVMSLVGAICSTSLTLFLPPFMEMVIFLPNEKSHVRKIFKALKNSVLLVLALLLFIFGLYAGIRDTIAEIQKDE